MPKRDDPFAGAKLSQEVGLDQRLFEPPPTQRPVGRKAESPQHRPVSRKVDLPQEGPAAPSAQRSVGPSNPQPAASTANPTEDHKGGLPVVALPDRSAERTTARPMELPAPSLGLEPASWPGQKQRFVDHRSYDFFKDQVRWLNHRKLEFEEKYGKRIAATDMVQLAVDLLIADYQVNGESSQVIRVLINEERPFVRKAEASELAPDSDQEQEVGDG